MKLACVFLALFCVGCGNQPTTPTVASKPAAQPSASPAAPPPAAAAPAPTAPPAPASVLATSDNDKGTGRAELMELKRISGGMLMLRVAIVNTGREPMEMSRQYVDDHTSDVYNLSGITLIDPVNKKKYFVVRDSESHCVCAEGLKDIKPGERTVAWARFPGPPEDVQKISVMIPHFSPMDEIAIGK